MSQTDTRNTTVNAVMRSLAFRQGIIDVREGVWRDCDNFKERDWWGYERGRAFAVADRDIRPEDCKPEKGTRTVAYWVQKRFVELIEDGTII